MNFRLEPTEMTFTFHSQLMDSWRAKWISRNCLWIAVWELYPCYAVWELYPCSAGTRAFIIPTWYILFISSLFNNDISNPDYITSQDWIICTVVNSQLCRTSNATFVAWVKICLEWLKKLTNSLADGRSSG